ncbi:hypothetical protein PV11_02120 [Exophiala sideris]|uniref:Luciferase domain-containing protein n=1 Tax=Exophiala sideris TaxID=1016849 RepID=A0A0D1WCT4_9EURO|nr:hypothetical protein PV11_02120 [Exophiala sideris]
MAKSISETAIDYITSFQRTYSSSYNNLQQRTSGYLSAFLTIGLVSAAIVGRLAWEDYQIFLGYGPGGMPYNVRGWFITNYLRFMSINTLDTRKMEADPDKRSWLSASDLKARTGERPKVGRHPVPQRQIEQIPAEDVRQKFLAKFQALGEQNAHLVQVKQSKYENYTQALWVRDDSDVYELDKKFNREISHVHSGKDYSAHVVLAPQDGVTVIKKGWGQLHGLAGVVRTPQVYVMLYAPRDEGEVEVLAEIMRAGIGYMTGADMRDVKGA